MYKENKSIYVLKAISAFFYNGEKFFETLYRSAFEKQNLVRVFEKFNIIISKISSYKEYKALYAIWIVFFYWLNNWMKLKFL